jgi:hypothetical protein
MHGHLLGVFTLKKVADQAEAGTLFYRMAL